MSWPANQRCQRQLPPLESVRICGWRQGAEAIESGESILADTADLITADGRDWSIRDGEVSYTLGIARMKGTLPKVVFVIDIRVR
jgi:hypothetical protein